MRLIIDDAYVRAVLAVVVALAAAAATTMTETTAMYGCRAAPADFGSSQDGGRPETFFLPPYHPGALRLGETVGMGGLRTPPKKL